MKVWRVVKEKSTHTFYPYSVAWNTEHKVQPGVKLDSKWIVVSAGCSGSILDNQGAMFYLRGGGWET